LTLSFNPFSNLEEAVFKHVRCPVVVHQSVDSAGRRPRVRVRMCRRVRRVRVCRRVRVQVRMCRRARVGVLFKVKLLHT